MIECNRNTGRTGMYKSMREYLSNLQTETASFATKVIRDETGTSVRGHDVDEVVLPPHYSMHIIYLSWVTSQGWKANYRNRANTRHNAIEKYTKADENDTSIYDDDEDLSRKQVCSYKCFQAFWKKEFQKLKIRKRGEDVCTDCVVFPNRLYA